MYEWLTGFPPFGLLDDQEIEELEEKIKTQPVPFLDYVSDPANDIISQLLDKDQDTRLTNVEKIKKMPFYKGIDWGASEAHGVVMLDDGSPMEVRWTPTITEDPTSNFDPEFTDRKPELKYLRPCRDGEFHGWYY